MSDSIGVGGHSGNTADPIRVLFVDDDRQWAQLMAEDIEAEADTIDITIAGSVTECLETFRDRDDIDCILADYQMPGKDGLQLLEAIREDNPLLPFLLVTSQGSEVVAARATDAGVTDYLIKDFGVDQALQFASKIETAVDHYRLQRAIEESEERYRTVTEQSRDAIAILQHGQVRFCNERFLELTGREREVLQGTDIVATIVHQEDRDQLRTVVSSWFEGDEQPRLHETRIVQPDGTIRHCEYTGGRITYTDEAATLVSIRDVTEREQRERELKWERELNRTVQEVLVKSETRESLERRIVRQLQQHGYALAWVGTRSNDTLVPRVVRGDRRYVERIDRTVSSEADAGEPAIDAAVTGTPQFCQDFETHPSAEWRDTALTYNYRSGGAVPLVYNDVPYGVLAVYHDEPGRFDDTERRLLTELADTVAFAIHSLETQSALASDRVVEAQLQVRGRYYLVDVARSGGFRDHGTVTVRETIPLDDDGVLQYLELEDGPATAVRETLLEHAAISEATIINEADPARLQVSVTDPVPEARLSARGRVVESTTVEKGGATVVVDLPAKEDVRQIVDALETVFDSVSVRTITEHKERRESRRLQGIDTAPLTEKQRTALKAAYFNGYFEQPRQGSATEIAESLGVSHSTFLRHLRTAQQKVFDQQFEQ